tara:strand:- start:3437 stop:4531 length:1095 start_codon:yes stop_codon:yes gene_type:complete
MTIRAIIDILTQWAPLCYAEDFDNVGLLTGSANQPCKGVLITLDTLEPVVDEAIASGCNLIVSFHPILFKGLKKITGDDYVQRTILKAIKHDIAIFTIHTALDNHQNGVNAAIAERLQLQSTKILVPKKGTIKKLVTYVPKENEKKVLEALYEAGAGALGNYDQCSFVTEGFGSFRGNEKSNPSLGQQMEKTIVEEKQIQVIFLAHQEKQILNSLRSAHPYETVAYEIISTDNENPDIGMGKVGTLKKPMSGQEFLSFVKKQMQTPMIRYSRLNSKPIQKVAVLGGSGSFVISEAKRSNADALVTADLKYHDFFQAEDQLLLVDIGHFESEQFTKNLIYSYLKKKLPNFAIILSNTITNPVNYF